MKKELVFIIIILIMNVNCFGQDKNSYYTKGMEIVLDSLLVEIPNVKFYLNDRYTTMDTSTDTFGSFDCLNDFENFKQQSVNIVKINIPKKHLHRFKKNNFFNKVIFGNKLVELNIDVLYENSYSVLFRANIYEKEGGIFKFVKFKNDSLLIDEFCKGYSIF